MQAKLKKLQDLRGVMYPMEKTYTKKL